MNAEKELIAYFNDELRRDFTRGAAFMTPSVAALGSEVAQRIFDTIAHYNDFCRESDPYQERDFGSFKIDGHMVFFKIDYYSKDMAVGSPDPSDPSVTTRVITIMLAQEC